MDSPSDSLFLKIQEELALPHPRASRLADYVRQVSDNVASCQPPKHLSVSEKQDLSEAAQAALDPPLQALLERGKILDIANALVCNDLTDLDSVAEAVCCPPATIEGIRNTAIKILKKELELRGLLLLRSVPSEESWFEQFCQKYPQASALQNAPWVEVQKYMQTETDGGSTSIEDHTSQYEDAIKEIWSQKNTLRKSVIKHRLLPSLAQELEDEGLTKVEYLEEAKVERLISEKGRSNAEKSRIRQLWQQESSEGKREEEFKVKSIQQQRVNTEEAVRLIDELISAGQKQQDAETKKTAARLVEVMSKLKVSNWKWSDEQLRKPTDFINDLKEVQSQLIDVSKYLKVVVPGTYRTDEEIIARTSAGLALYGFSFGGSADSDRLGMKPSRPVLCQPVFCPLKSPAYGNSTISKSFSSIEAASCYRNTVISSGNSFAAGFKASGWGFNVDTHGGFTRARENETKSTKGSQGSFAANVTYMLIPMKSFRIPKAQMKLSVEAEQEARAVISLQKAQVFLDQFGSHVSNGIHHLGGIFWRITIQESGESIEESEDQGVALDNWDLRAASGFNSFGMDVTADVRNEASSSTGTGKGKQQINRKHKTSVRIETDGPNVIDPGLFAELLASNNQSWFIIDRAGGESLISIWELLKDYCEDQMDRAAALIRSAWLERASHSQFANVKEIQREIHRTVIDQFASEASPKEITCPCCACRDVLWEAKLPGCYDEILEKAVEIPAPSSSKKDIYDFFCRGVFIEEGYAAFSIDKATGGLSRSQGARGMSITWGNDERYWSWLPREGSSFSEVAYMKQVCWLEVRGQMVGLLPVGNYTLSWRLFFLEGFRNCKPLLFDMETEGGLLSHRAYFLDSHRWEDKQTVPHVRSGSSEKSGWRPVHKNWMEFDVGVFTVTEGSMYPGMGIVALKYSLIEIEGGDWKSGLFLDGVIVRPVRKPTCSPGNDLPE